MVRLDPLVVRGPAGPADQPRGPQQGEHGPLVAVAAEALPGDGRAERPARDGDDLQQPPRVVGQADDPRPEHLVEGGRAPPARPGPASGPSASADRASSATKNGLPPDSRATASARPAGSGPAAPNRCRARARASPARAGRRPARVGPIPPRWGWRTRRGGTGRRPPPRCGSRRPAAGQGGRGGGGARSGPQGCRRRPTAGRRSPGPAAAGPPGGPAARAAPQTPAAAAPAGRAPPPPGGGRIPPPRPGAGRGRPGPGGRRRAAGTPRPRAAAGAAGVAPGRRSGCRAPCTGPTPARSSGPPGPRTGPCSGPVEERLDQGALARPRRPWTKTTTVRPRATSAKAPASAARWASRPTSGNSPPLRRGRGAGRAVAARLRGPQPSRTSRPVGRAPGSRRSSSSTEGVQVVGHVRGESRGGGGSYRCLSIRT